MFAYLSGLIAIILYLLGALFQARALFRGEIHRGKVLGLGAAGAIAHIITLWLLIVSDQGYDLGLYKIASLFSWTMVVLALLNCLRRPLEGPLLMLYPLAALCILASLSLSSAYQPHDFSPGTATHILLAILAYSVIAIAAAQALLLAYQDHQLKDRNALKRIGRLPPLQTMEALLFELLWTGLVLLSLVIASGVIFMDSLLAQQLSHKFVLSLIAWVVFAILLWGRHQLGWRGKTAIRWTLTGFMFLALAYFGSKLVVELILNQS